VSGGVLDKSKPEEHWREEPPGNAVPGASDRPVRGPEREQTGRIHHLLKYFLEYLERTSSLEAPQIAVGKLIWPEDGGEQLQHQYTGDKFIPESVLYQLEQHMHQLPSKYLPIVIILRASGWRIGDVLNLRYDTCLERTPSGSVGN
jgi:hypothetical protein